MTKEVRAQLFPKDKVNPVELFTVSYFQIVTMEAHIYKDRSNVKAKLKTQKKAKDC